MPLLIAIGAWVATSILVGFLGRRRALGFWGVFFYSVVFSPIGGALALVVGRSPASRTRVVTSRTTPAHVTSVIGRPLVTSNPARSWPSGPELKTMLGFFLAWAAIVILFAIPYTIIQVNTPTNRPSAEPFRIGLGHSLDAAVFATNTYATQNLFIHALSILERFLVLALLVLTTGRVARSVRESKPISEILQTPAEPAPVSGDKIISPVPR